MEKALQFLEKNVQWFALGIGGLVLVWAAYAYMVVPPATVSIGPDKVLPSQVSDKTRTQVANAVKKELINPSVPDFPTVPVVENFDKQMHPGFVPAQPMYAYNSIAGGGVAETGPRTEDEKIHLAVLPNPPKAVPLAAVAGISTIQLPAPAADPNAKPKPSVTAKPVVATKDKVWTTASFVLKADDLKKAFEEPVKGQPQVGVDIYNTAIIGVVIQRQEWRGVDADGADLWGDPTPVSPLAIHPIHSFPGDQSSDQEKFEYLKWAQENPSDIYQPTFYEVVAGTVWQAPQPAGAATDAATAPATPTAPIAPAPDPRKAQDDLKRQQAEQRKAELQQRRALEQQQQRRPAGHTSGTYHPYYLPENGGGNNAAAQQRQQREYMEYMRRLREQYGHGARPGMAPPGVFPGAMPGPQPFPGPGFAPRAGQPAAAGTIDPLQATEDILIWVNDDQVQAGHSYRYRIMYILKNPVFKTFNMASAADSAKLSLQSPWSDWSAKAVVPETTRFWFTQVLNGKAQFDVFHWKDGQWRSSHHPLTPGDIVPNTEWTVIDLRDVASVNAREKYVLLADSEGKVQRRDLKKDNVDPDLQEMKNQANAAHASAEGQNSAPVASGFIAPPRPLR